MSLPFCKNCKTILKDYRSKKCKSCSKKGKKNPMYNKLGTLHPRYKGGSVTSGGYKRVIINRQIMYEHRAVIEKHIGRPLLKREVVHHVNGNKLDNSLENLQIITQAQHVSIHKPMLGKKSKTKRDPLTQRFTK